MTAARALALAGALLAGPLGCRDAPSTLWDPEDPTTGPTDPAWPPAVAIAPPFDLGPWATMPDRATIAIGWRTTAPTLGWLELVASPDGALEVDWAAAERVDDPAAAAAELHEVRLAGLAPATAYRYRVHAEGDDGFREGVFVTSGAERWRFVHLAELHAPTDAAFAAEFAGPIRRFRPHLAIESGDMVDFGDELDDWRTYFAVSAPWVSNLILLPAHSNHVNGTGGSALLRSLFALPDNERWYTTRYGDVELVSLDSTYELNPDTALEGDFVRQRLAEALAAADPPRHVVAAWHYPACSSLYQDRAAQRRWVIDELVAALGETEAFRLALVGHDKYYERSRLAVAGREVTHVMANVGKLAPGVSGDNAPECTTEVTLPEVRSLGTYAVEGDVIRGWTVDPDDAELDAFVVE
jgi:hypothetical protein